MTWDEKEKGEKEYKKEIPSQLRGLHSLERMRFLLILLLLPLLAEPANWRCMQDDKLEEFRCFAYFRMWKYNKTSGDCEEFTYGGCGGNSNRFKSRIDCKATCDDPLKLYYIAKKIGGWLGF